MARFEWDSSLELGYPEIDDQHRGLFDLANRLDEALSCVDTQEDAVANAIYGLSDYAIEHFTDEEALMLEAAYPGRGSHRSLHEHLSAETMRMMSRYFAGEHVAATEIAPFVTDWLQQHIRREDMNFVEFLRGRSAS